MNLYRRSLDRTRELVERVVDHLRQKLPAGETDLVEEFVRRYFADVPPDDLLDRSVADLCGAALSHFNFGRQRRAGQTRVRVFNPQAQEHAWQSSHTIVEVVSDDMPFLVDSVSMELNRHGLTIHLTVHPIIEVKRDRDGILQAIGAGGAESYLHIEVDRHGSGDFLSRIQADLERVLADVAAAVADWPAMSERLRALAVELETRPPAGARNGIDEIVAFLRWLERDHFTFLGYREYEFGDKGSEDALHIVSGSGLGILRETAGETASSSFAGLTPRARQRALEPDVLVLTKANSRSTVHRPVYMDYVGIKRFDERGAVVGEHRFLGLYTSSAYSRDPRDIPLLRRKVQQVVDHSGLPPGSHAGKALLNILQTFPRDELFQSSREELFDAALGILHLQERQRVRLFLRVDRYDRFFSCMVFVPREHYDTALAHRMERILRNRLNARSVEFSTLLSESVLARLHFIVHTDPDQIPDVDVKALERRLTEAARSWKDRLRESLIAALGEEHGTDIFRRYRSAFSAGYVESFSAATAVSDIQRMEKLRDAESMNVDLYKPSEKTDDLVYLKLFHLARPVPLSDALPMLENMGLRVIGERLYKVVPTDHEPIWIHEFGLVPPARPDFDTDEVEARFQNAFTRIWHAEMENDGFNRLVLSAEFEWRDTVLIRAYCKFLVQSRLPFSQAYMEQTLGRNLDLARLLVRYFKARFDPELGNTADRGTEGIEAEIEKSLDAVASLDEDRILRQLFACMRASVRTNYFVLGPDRRPPRYLSFKLDSQRVPALPEPRPMFEIFVYSTRVEAVHLRGGKVARGGIRWSDRREDFRTEVLGLMKTQTVKNAIIVPVGAKGGFVVKRPPGDGDRDALMAEVIECYREFMQGMLDITDNIVSGEVVPPRDVVRHDDDDPYLVVAADKGTATFSDFANSIAKDYGYWLDDAFASGGSTGYDHKKMGITARGAWESVKQHFRELGRDVDQEPFTVIGIGDMSGDVFGNGMLLSRSIRLVAAFNHRYIFLDPEPDPELSFSERQRLFELPRSSWSDYDASRISSGGGVFPRTAKSIRISSEARRALAISAEHMSPNELISAILRAPVDLLWNGGIGTFVKASPEAHADARDRGNDAIRVDASELRCKVVGEGGNLGFTQLGRVEFARRGGFINTDSVDNSGGVNCSDREVNIKILCNTAVADGRLTRSQRDALLADMTEAVGAMVLADNHAHTRAISMSAAHAPEHVDTHAEFMRSLERSGRLDRALERLPGEEELAERRASGEGLSRPELCVLSAYSKLALYHDLIGSPFPDDPCMRNELTHYFPAPLVEGYAAYLGEHPLRREIIATHLTNSLTNTVGITFVHRLYEMTGRPAEDVARAFATAREIFDVAGLVAAIDDLDHRVPTTTQLSMLDDVRRLAERGSLWLLKHRAPDYVISDTIAHFHPGVRTVAAELDRLVSAAHRRALHKHERRLSKAGVPQATARRISGLGALYSGLDIVEVTHAKHVALETAAGVYFAVGSRLELFWLREQINALPMKHHWQERAKAALYDDLYRCQRALAGDVLDANDRARNAYAILQHWAAGRADDLERLNELLADLHAAPKLDLAMLSVAVREVQDLAQNGRRLI